MAIPDQFFNDVVFSGNATFTKATALGPLSVTDAMVATAAGISASKVIHQVPMRYAQTGNASAETKVIGILRGTTCVMVDAKVTCVTAAVGTGVIVTMDIKKNGTTILSAPMTLTASTAAYGTVSGSLSVTTGTVGDVITAVTTATAGGGTLPTGLAGALTVQETAI